MSSFTSMAQSHIQQLDQFKLFQNLESKTKVPRTYWTSSSVVLYLLLTFLNVGGMGEILSNFIGFIIPTINSIKALKTKGDHSDDQFWLSYWIIFGFLNIIEFWSSTILYLVPFYWVLKVVFLLYISIPSTGGCQWVYNKLIEPSYDQLVNKLISIANKEEGSSSTSSNENNAGDIRQAVKNTAAKATGASRHHRH
ncbi:ER membrane protein DP1/Yop1 [Monosporozyma unispora]|nr:ER membrane protein DP1/Yop1 [Kazachstania unispora]